MDLGVIQGITKPKTSARRVKPPQLEVSTTKPLRWNGAVREYGYVANGNRI